MSKVLLLGGGTQGLCIADCLRKCKHQIYLISNERHNYAEDSNCLEECFYMKSKDDEDYLQKLKEYISRHSIDCIIPMGDNSAEFISKYKSELLQVVRFKAPDYDAFLEGYDKNRLMALCRGKGYPHPQTIDLSIVDYQSEEAQIFPYPAMLKPNCTTGGRGMVEVKSYEEVLSRYPELHAQYGGYHLQRFIKAGGKQVKIQLYLNDKGELLQKSVMQKMRWYPNKAGSNCCARSIENEHIVDICYNILKDIKWVGFADFDAIEDPDTGELLIMEINPRIPACIKAACAAGINWGEVIVNDIMGLPQRTYPYETDICMRHLGLDTLWFLHADNKWSTKPSWFKLIGKNIYYQDMNGWKDMKPFIMGSWHNIKKLFDPEFKKAKQG